MNLSLDHLEFAPPGKCFILHSGAHTNVRIVVEKLRHVPLWHQMLPSGWGEYAFWGVQSGGVWLLERMGRSILQKQGLVDLAFTTIIDDVYTTGASIDTFIAEQGLDPKACLVWVMFLRGDLPLEGKYAGFAYHVDARHLPLWTAGECPFCRAEEYHAWLGALR